MGTCKTGKCVHAQTEQHLTQPFGSSGVFFQKASAPSLLFIQLALCSPDLSPLTGSLHLESSLSCFGLWRYKVEGRIMYGLLPYRGTLVWVKRKRNSSVPSFPSYFQKIKKLTAFTVLTIHCD